MASRLVSFRLEDAAREKLEALAKADHRNLSDYIRSLILEKLERERLLMGEDGSRWPNRPPEEKEEDREKDKDKKEEKTPILKKLRHNF